MDTKELNALKDRAYKTAIAHGFHEEEKPDAFWLGLVMSEMGEAINADRKGLHANVVRFVEDMELGNPFKDSFERHIKDSLEDELADIVIRLLDFSGLKGYTLLISGFSALPSTAIVDEFAKNGLPGTLLALIGTLSDSLVDDSTEATVGLIINIFIDCFKKITGRDYDLLWFVKQKMRYNELRPNSKGEKKY